MSVLSGDVGTVKLARFRILKNSARNCTLKLSEILLTGLFLNSEKSKFERPGPVRMLRPELPLRLKHCGGVPTAVPGPNRTLSCGSELHNGTGAVGKKNEAGAVGTSK